MKDDTTFIRKAVLACAGALTLMAFLALGSYWVMQVQIMHESTSASSVSTSARQRMLLQRAALLGLSLVSTTDRNLRTLLRHELEELANSIEAAHIALSQGQGFAPPSAMISAMYFEPPLSIDKDIRNFVSELRSFIALSPDQYAFDNPHLYYVVSASTGLYTKFETLIERYRYEAEQGILELSRYQRGILLFTFAVLILTGGFIFRPMIIRLKQELEQRRKAAAELEQSAQQLTQQTENLARSNKELEQFAGVVAHDLRAPLQNLHSLGRLLRTKTQLSSDTEVQEWIAHMDHSLNRMDRLITDLLRYSKVVSEARPPAPVSLPEVLEEVLSDLQPLVAEAHATIDQKPLPTVWADRTQMRQLFQNIVQNAIKFRHPDRAPHIEICAKQLMLHGKVQHQISVEDNGIGFDPADVPRIFRMFGRLHEEGYEGSGIGLATCERIVKRHGWSISAEGRLGEGARMIITIPETNG